MSSPVRTVTADGPSRLVRAMREPVTTTAVGAAASVGGCVTCACASRGTHCAPISAAKRFVVFMVGMVFPVFYCSPHGAAGTEPYQLCFSNGTNKFELAYAAARRNARAAVACPPLGRVRRRCRRGCCRGCCRNDRRVIRRQQRCFLLLGRLQVTLLDVTVAADVLGDAGNGHGRGQVVGRQFRQQC